LRISAVCGTSFLSRPVETTLVPAIAVDIEGMGPPSAVLSMTTATERPVRGAAIVGERYGSYFGEHKMLAHQKSGRPYLLKSAMALCPKPAMRGNDVLIK